MCFIMCMPVSCYCQQTEALMLSLLTRPGLCGVIVGQDWRVSGSLPTPPPWTSYSVELSGVCAVPVVRVCVQSNPPPFI